MRWRLLVAVVVLVGSACSGANDTVPTGCGVAAIFTYPGATDEHIKTIRIAIEDSDAVEIVRVLSPQEALDSYPELYADVDTDTPLSAAFELRAAGDVDAFDEFVDQSRDLPGVLAVLDSEPTGGCP